MQSIESKNKTLEIINFLQKNKFECIKNFNIDNLTFKNNQIILIEPSTENKKFAGMQIIYFKNENELHIFSNNENLIDSLKCLLKGNKRSKKDILKIWK